MFFEGYGNIVEMFVLRGKIHAYVFLFFFLFQKTSSYMKDPWDPPPPSNICLRCGKPGHDRKNCPTKWVRLWGASGVTEPFRVFTLAFM